MINHSSDAKLHTRMPKATCVAPRNSARLNTATHENKAVLSFDRVSVTAPLTRSNALQRHPGNRTLAYAAKLPNKLKLQREKLGVLFTPFYVKDRRGEKKKKEKKKERRWHAGVEALRINFETGSRLRRHGNGCWCGALWLDARGRARPYIWSELRHVLEG